MNKAQLHIVILALAVLFHASGTPAQAVQGATYNPEAVRLDEPVVATPRSVTPMDLLTLRDPKGVSISPDGTQIAFAVGQAEYQTNGYRSGLFLVGTKPGSPIKTLGTAGMPHWDNINQWLDESPVWSPDSKWVSYRTRMRSEDNWRVSIWDSKTGSKKQEISVPGDVETYRWCYDGTALFLTTLKPRKKTQDDGGILFNSAVHPYQVIPILTQIDEAKEPEREYWIYDFKTENSRAATQQEIAKWRPWSAIPTAEQNPALAKYDILGSSASADGSEVAYEYMVTDPAESKTLAVRLLLVSAQGAITELTPGAHRVDQFWWTANGTKLYFTQHDGKGHSAELWAFHIGDSQPELAYRAIGRDFLSSFSSDDTGDTIACLREDTTSPPKIALIDAKNNQIHSLVDLNPKFSSLLTSVPERIEGTNTYGESWYAYLVKPLDFIQGRKYPLIVTTYRSGDYFLRGASGDENPIQVYAAHGFAVLCVDVGWIRNRVTGDFDATLLNWASPAASIEQAVRMVAQDGIIDISRVGIAGFSHGEEIAGYALIHTDLFRAAIGAQNYDPFFYYLGSDEWHGIFQQWNLGGWPDGKLNPAWRKIAMSMNADKIVTPILENASDTEYLIYVSTFRSLKDVGKPIELYIYPNELHVRNQPKHKLEIYERNFDWFCFWLKDEENTSPRDPRQLGRWRQMRQFQDQNEAPSKR